MNPIIKFTTLFGLLAVELALGLSRSVNTALSAAFFAVALYFVYRSFYGMRITASEAQTAATQEPAAARRH